MHKDVRCKVGGCEGEGCMREGVIKGKVRRDA